MPSDADVLVVEDEPDIRHLIAHHLGREGFRCREVATGAEALRAVRTSIPDLIVLDLMLPEMGGLDPGRHTVMVRGAPVALTPKEFDLLQVLLEASGRVLSREHLLTRVWGYAHADEIESRTVDVHVRRLRAKLGDDGRRIATVKSVGDRFEREEGGAP